MMSQLQPINVYSGGADSLCEDQEQYQYCSDASHIVDSPPRQSPGTPAKGEAEVEESPLLCSPEFRRKAEQSDDEVSLLDAIRLPSTKKKRQCLEDLCDGWAGTEPTGPCWSVLERDAAFPERWASLEDHRAAMNFFLQARVDGLQYTESEGSYSSGHRRLRRAFDKKQTRSEGQAKQRFKNGAKGNRGNWNRDQISASLSRSAADQAGARDAAKEALDPEDALRKEILGKLTHWPRVNRTLALWILGYAWGKTVYTESAAVARLLQELRFLGVPVTYSDAPEMVIGWMRDRSVLTRAPAYWVLPIEDPDQELLPFFDQLIPRRFFRSGTFIERKACSCLPYVGGNPFSAHFMEDEESWKCDVCSGAWERDALNRAFRTLQTGSLGVMNTWHRFVDQDAEVMLLATTGGAPYVTRERWTRMKVPRYFLSQVLPHADVREGHLFYLDNLIRSVVQGTKTYGESAFAAAMATLLQHADRPSYVEWHRGYTSDVLIAAFWQNKKAFRRRCVYGHRDDGYDDQMMSHISGFTIGGVPMSSTFVAETAVMTTRTGFAMIDNWLAQRELKRLREEKTQELLATSRALGDVPDVDMDPDFPGGRGPDRDDDDDDKSHTPGPQRFPRKPPPVDRPCTLPPKAEPAGDVASGSRPVDIESTSSPVSSGSGKNPSSAGSDALRPSPVSAPLTWGEAFAPPEPTLFDKFCATFHSQEDLVPVEPVAAPTPGPSTLERIKGWLPFGTVAEQPMSDVELVSLLDDTPAKGKEEEVVDRPFLVHSEVQADEVLGVEPETIIQVPSPKVQSPSPPPSPEWTPTPSNLGSLTDSGTFIGPEEDADGLPKDPHWISNLFRAIRERNRPQISFEVKPSLLDGMAAVRSATMAMEVAMEMTIQSIPMLSAGVGLSRVLEDGTKEAAFNHLLWLYTARSGYANILRRTSNLWLNKRDKKRPLFMPCFLEHLDMCAQPAVQYIGPLITWQTQSISVNGVDLNPWEAGQIYAYDKERISVQLLTDEIPDPTRVSEVLYGAYFQGFHCFGNDFLLHTLVSRLGRTIPIPVEGRIQRFQMFCLKSVRFPKLQEIKDSPTLRRDDYLEYTANMPGSRRKVHMAYFDALDSVTAPDPHAKVADSAFTKPDECLFSPKARSIVNPPLDLFYLMVHHSTVIKKALKSDMFIPCHTKGPCRLWFTYGADLTYGEKARWFTYACELVKLAPRAAVVCVGGDDNLTVVHDQGRLFSWESDVTACDQSHNEGLVQGMLLCLLNMGLNHEAVRFLRSTYRRPIHVPGLLNIQFKKPQLHTGHPHTSVANTLVIGLMGLHLMTEWDWKSPLDEFLTRRTLELGMIWKIQLNGSVWDSTFHKGCWIRGDLGAVWMRLPSSLWKSTKLRTDTHLNQEQILLRLAFNAYQNLVNPSFSWVKAASRRMFDRILERLKLDMPALLAKFSQPKFLSFKQSVLLNKAGEAESLGTMAYDAAPYWDVGDEGRFIHSRYALDSCDIDAIEQWNGDFAIVNCPDFRSMILRDYGSDNFADYMTKRGQPSGDWGARPWL